MNGKRKEPEAEMGKYHTEIQGIFFFDPKDRIYQDHFPGNPVVPGSVIIHSFLSALQKAGFPSQGLIIEKFRFKKFVSPGEYEYQVRIGKEDIACELYKNEQMVVKGNLKP
jgi:3-hydroxyacyl-[acyl-carrier-protein] dehydratase